MNEMNEVIEKEIDEMESALSDFDDVVEEPTKDIVEEPEPEAEPEPESEEETVEEEVEETVDEEPTEEPEPESQESATAPEFDRIRSENEELRQRLERLEKAGEPKTNAPSTEAPIEDVRFVEDDDAAYEATRTADGLNRLLNEVYKRGVTDAYGRARETIPKTIRSEQDEIQRRVDRTNKFYQENEDLVPWKKTVGAVFNELHMQNPSKSEEELMQSLAAEVRSRIGIKGKQVTNSASDSDNEPSPPPLPKKRGQQRQRPEPELTGLEAEIDEMNKTLSNF